MKGLVLSLVVFAGYALSIILLSHILRPKRHGRLFLFGAAGWTPVYFCLFLATPDDLYILSRGWMCSIRWLDLVYGYVVFILNCHSLMDCFFGFNGGFSTSLMRELLRAGPTGLSTQETIALYRRPNGTDAIYGWRVPRLEQTGYLVVDRATGMCRLTAKGRVVARLTSLCKRALDLGAGG